MVSTILEQDNGHVKFRYHGYVSCEGTIERFSQSLVFVDRGPYPTIVDGAACWLHEPSTTIQVFELKEIDQVQGRGHKVDRLRKDSKAARELAKN